MENIVLKKVSSEYAEQILTYRKEFINNNEVLNGTGFLTSSNSAKEYIDKSILNETEEIDGLVTATQLLAIKESDNKIVGMIQIRHFLNDYILKYGGHIGYSVRKSERKKGYAKEMLRQALCYCKDELNINRILVTCDKNNEASRKTILSQGGKKENELFLEEDDNIIVERYWINI